MTDQRLAARSRARGALLRVAITATGVTLALGCAGASAASTPPVTISPISGTPAASPHTQISFLGAPASEISDISVVGSRSGSHPGHLRSYDSATGASFIPNAGFEEGERVTVQAMVGPAHHQQRVTSSFQIARLFHYKFPPKGAHQAATSGAGVQSFVSEPGLHPPAITVQADSPSASAGDIFFAFNEGTAQWGPTIVNGSGGLIWFQPVPSDEHAMDFKVAEYAHEPALVWWQGYIAPIGVGFGTDEIYNDRYQKVAEVSGGNGYHADLHEVLVTPQGQAYITAYSLVDVNLSSLHGFKEAGLLDAVMQEIDIKTGLVMWEWQSYGHVSLDESYSKPPSSKGWPYDYFHINSISLDPSGDGNILISARNTWAGYEINHATGQIEWQLGGKKPSFKMGPGTETAYQHDIRWQPNGTITAFDDGASPQVHKQSRVIHEQIEWKTKEVKLISAEVHSPALIADSQGNDQLLSNGNSFVGWGQAPYITEFASNGSLLFQAQLPGKGDSYRAYRFPWKGTPASPPDIAVSNGASGTVNVYASWNGATEVSSWRVLGWDEVHHTSVLGAAPIAGFETMIPVKSGDSWYAVQAISASGKVLATSNAAKG